MVHGNSGMFNFTHMYIHHCILWHEWIIFCDVGYTCMVRVLAAMLWHWSLLLVMITLVMLPSQIRNSHSGDCFSLRSQPHDTMQDVAYIISIYRPQLIKMYVAMYISVFAGYGCVCFFGSSSSQNPEKHPEKIHQSKDQKVAMPFDKKLFARHSLCLKPWRVAAMDCPHRLWPNIVALVAWAQLPARASQLLGMLISLYLFPAPPPLW